MLCPEPATARQEPLPKNHRETPRENPLSLQSACLGVGDAVPPTAPSPRMAVSSEWDPAQAVRQGRGTGRTGRFHHREKGHEGFFTKFPPLWSNHCENPQEKVDFDWSIILTQQSPALAAGVRHRQHRQVLSLLSKHQCQVPNTSCRNQDKAERCQNYTEHPSPWGHTARAPRRAWTPHLCSHQQHFPAWSCKITNKNLCWAAQAQTTSQKPVPPRQQMSHMAKQVRFPREQALLSYLG